MTGSVYWEQLRFCGDHFHGALKFGDGAEGVACAVDEERGRAQVGKMLRALLLGAARRMERVGEQQEGRGQVWLLGAEHAGLASAIGVASEVDAAGQHCSHLCDCVLQACAVADGVAGAGRAKRTRLAKWQIAAEDGEARGGKGLGQGAE